MEAIVYQLTEQQIKELIKKTVLETLKTCGIRPGKEQWMSLSAAYRLKGRRKVDAALKVGKVEFEKKDFAKKQCHVRVRIEDIEKL